MPFSSTNAVHSSGYDTFAELLRATFTDNPASTIAALLDVYIETAKGSTDSAELVRGGILQDIREFHRLVQKADQTETDTETEAIRRYKEIIIKISQLDAPAWQLTTDTGAVLHENEEQRFVEHSVTLNAVFKTIAPQANKSFFEDSRSRR